MAPDNRTFRPPRVDLLGLGCSRVSNDRATRRLYGRGIDVQVLRWPAERERREDLARRRIPRLLLVDDGDSPPPVDGLEDWAFAAASEREVAIRLEALRERTRGREALVVDADGIVRRGALALSVSPLEARLVRTLADRQSAVVSREALGRAGWGSPPERNVLDVHVSRLRRRLSPLGVAIRTVRSRGYMLELSGTVQEHVSEP